MEEPAMSARVTVRCLVPGVLVVGLALLGCGPPKTYTVKGRVTFKDTDKPLTHGTVLLILQANTAVRASADIESDGSFTMATTTGMGAVPGDYQMLIQPGYGESAQTVSFHPRYLRIETSGLTYTVTPGDNFIDLKLEKAPGRR